MNCVGVCGYLCFDLMSFDCVSLIVDDGSGSLPIYLNRHVVTCTDFTFVPGFEDVLTRQAAAAAISKSSVRFANFTTFNAFLRDLGIVLTLDEESSKRFFVFSD